MPTSRSRIVGIAALLVLAIVYAVMVPPSKPLKPVAQPAKAQSK